MSAVELAVDAFAEPMEGRRDPGVGRHGSHDIVT